ncbi:unnamed protein product [Leptidea sinapis]|uniref:Uncharacterized protein n=1 Tax=Leptidea sinapis TaxID=189913 RepID=A0A5E4PSB3_9NEOP|nr:unnamed protein product [Leptidea sinapis]
MTWSELTRDEPRNWSRAGTAGGYSRCRYACGTIRRLLGAPCRPSRRRARRMLRRPGCSKESYADIDQSVFSTSSESSRSGVSVASGFTKRLSAFRRTLAPKVQEPALVDEIPEQVVTLGFLEQAPEKQPSTTSARSRKSFR